MESKAVGFEQVGQSLRLWTPLLPYLCVALSAMVSSRLLMNYRLLAPFALFMLALIPRAYDLARFVTADEAKWVYRSAQFLAAFLSGDFAATQVNLTPAVTTTWLGSLGLTLYYALHQATINQPFLDWLRSLPEFRTDLDILVATRWPLVIVSSLSIVAMYTLARRWLNPQVAWVAAALIALDPHTVSLSRVLGHDAPAALFLTLALLSLIPPLHLGEGRGEGNFSLLTSHSLLLSAFFAALAFLSKAPTFFLLPFAALFMLIEGKYIRAMSLRSITTYFIIWFTIAYLTFILIWPAAWLQPLGAPYRVIENAFISATDHDEAAAENYWLVPELGLFYYPINALFKVSPLVLVGVGLALWRLGHEKRLSVYKASSLINADKELSRYKASSLITANAETRGIIWLMAFAVLFTMFMTLGDKRSPRYILPIFPTLSFIAVWGWQGLLHLYSDKTSQVSKTFEVSTSPLARPFYASLVVAAALILWPYSPYYLTYYNPLVGGAWTAPHWVKIGWGEGLDEVGRFLQQSPTYQGQRIGTVYASTVAPYFSGKISGVESDNITAIVLYIKQVQSGEPSIPFIRYFQYQDPLHSIELNGLHYADVYAGPPLTSLPNNTDQQLIAYRPLAPHGRVGEALKVDVLWLPTDITNSQPTLTMQPLTGTLSHLISSQVPLQQLAPEALLSQHVLTLPLESPPGDYQLLLDGQPLGQIAWHNFQRPHRLTTMPEPTLFGDKIALIGYQFAPTADYIQVKLAWQAQADNLPDCVMFVHLLDDKQHIVAAWQAAPLNGAWPTSRWLKGEVVLDDFHLAVPPHLPNGAYQVIAGIIDSTTQQRLALDSNYDQWVIPWTFIWNAK